MSLDVVSGKTYLLQLINAALNNNHFFQIANHTMTVVATDGEYVKPFNTTRVVLSPGQSLDVLVTANQPTGKVLNIHFTSAIGCKHQFVVRKNSLNPLSLCFKPSSHIRHVGVIWIVFHVLQSLLLIRYKYQNMCCTSKSKMKHQQNSN